MKMEFNSSKSFHPFTVMAKSRSTLHGEGRIFTVVFVVFCTFKVILTIYWWD